MSEASGTMIVVVGPSGAGKDTLMDYARQRLLPMDDIAFVQRVITRDSSAGGEDHRSVTAPEFEAMRAQGAFAVAWGAHGLHYGIPVNTLARIALGETLVVNGSRAAIGEFRKVYAKLVVVCVTARPEIIAARLGSRGRESAEDIGRRIARETGNWQCGSECIEIDNSGNIDDAGGALLGIIQAVAARTELATAAC
jgi:ribose 1,5-bisphosphokinase